MVVAEGETTKATRKLKVHEVRFFDPKPRAIQGLAYESKSHRLAVVKCTVDAQENIPAAYFVEIWNLRDFPCLEFKVTLASEWRQSVEAVCWRSSRLLFISGMHGQVLLVDIETSRLRNQAAAVSGPVWCMSLNPQKNRLAAGTEDGYISLFDVESEELIIFNGLLEPKGSRILSLSWHLVKPLLVSSGRGRVWLWDLEAMKLRMEMAPPKHGNIEASVSSVIFLRNDTVVSGDSTGATIFWDITNGTPITTFKSRSGVLSLAHSQSPEGISLFSAGIDSVISEMRLTTQQGSSSWVKSLPRYLHSHDVRALCRAGKYLVSGGQDSYLMFGNDFSIKDTIKVPPNTNSSSVAVSRNPLNTETPFLLLQNSSKLEIWQLSSQKNSSTAENFKAVPYCQLLSLTFGKGNECITTSAISPSGEWLVASSPRLTKAYRIVPTKAESLGKNVHDKVDIDLVPASKTSDIFAHPVECLVFSENDKIVVADSSEVYECKLTWNASGEHSASLSQKRFICSLFPDERIRLLAASANGRFTAIVTSRNKVEVFDLAKASGDMVMAEDDDDDEERSPQRRTSHKTILPSQSASIITALAFSSHKEADLVMTYADGTVAAFNLHTLFYQKVPIGGMAETLERSSKEVVAFTHCSVQGDLAVLHNWKAGVLLCKEGKQWTVKKELSYDENVISSTLSTEGELINVIQSPAMIRNQLPPALAKKVFGV